MRKGFTLVELAIVLVIIGIIMGMAIKGKALIDVAKVRGELAKIKQIEAAVATFVAKYDERRPDNITDLLDSGLIQPDDIISIFAEGHSFDIVECSRTQKTNYLANNKFNQQTWKDYPDTCLVSDRPASKDIDPNWAFNFSRRLACHIEVSFDDQNVLTGMGRNWYQMIAAETEIVAADYEDCDKLSGLAAYGYIVF